MKLAYPQFDFCIESEENKANVLVIESPIFLRRVVSEIDSQIKWLMESGRSTQRNMHSPVCASAVSVARS